MPKRKRYTRRDFLGLAGLSAFTGSLACVAGVTGYLLLSPSGRANSSRPSATPTRSDRIKQIARPPIVTRAEWGAREPNHEAENEPGYYNLENVDGWREYPGDIRSVYRTVIVHHSVEYEEDDIATAHKIQDLHMDDRKWADIAYHFMVGKNGQIYEGRALNTRGTHVSFYNTGSVGVVFMGNFQVEAPTEAQLIEGQQMIRWLALRLELTHLAGHYQFNEETVCPGSNMIPLLAGFAAAAGLIWGTEGYEPSAEQLVTPTPTPDTLP